MLAWIVQSKSAVTQPHHAVVVGKKSGKQCRPARRTARGRAECLAEHNALGGESIQIRRGDARPVTAQMATGVVRMNQNDVWSAHRTAGREASWGRVTPSP